MSFVVALGFFLLVAGWEFVRPRRRREFPALARRLGNLGVWVANLLLAAFLFDGAARLRPLVEATLGTRLPTWPVDDPWLSLAAGFVLLDLARYAIHRCEHAVPFLWRFHALHHSDPDVDVTTAVRHHPIEYLLVSALYWAAVLVFDIPAIVVLAHGLALFCASMLQHGNICLPERLEGWLQPVLVTPDMHRLHHSSARRHADANYGAVLSVWDRLFGTRVEATRAEHRDLVFGVRELRRRDALKPWTMLRTPWLLPG